jgi:toxin-antitoxin system PIN domain toxin
MFVLDTNVLIDAVNKLSTYHDACRRVLDDSRRQSGAWHTTWGICYEFLRVTTHRAILKQPLTALEGWSVIAGLFQSSGFSMLTPTDRHADVAKEVFGENPTLSGNLMHDAETAILMREHGIKTIYTRDMDFHHFPFLEVVDPTASKSSP